MICKKTPLPKIFVFMLFAFICCSFFLTNTGGAAAAAEEEIKLTLDGEPLRLDVPPFIEEGRTMVPVRAAFEALGADVGWDGERKKVTIVLDGVELQLTLGDTIMRANGYLLELSHPPQIVEGRTMVPLRALAETFGMDVSWDGEKRAVTLRNGETRLQVDREMLKNDVSPYYKDIEAEVDIYGVKLGDSAETLQRERGRPSRIDFSIYGYEWWIYNDDPQQYLQVGVNEDRVVSIYAGGEDWNFEGLSQGSPSSELLQRFAPAEHLTAEEEGKKFQLFHPTLVYEHVTVTFYTNPFEKTVDALRLEARDTTRERHLIFYRHLYADGPSEYIEESELEKAQKAKERQIFDLVNKARAAHGVPQLEWSEEAAEASRKHSREMFRHDYFSHRCPLTGQTLSDRLDERGVDFRLAGENLARGQQDAVEVHHSLMNSPGHRENILKEGFRHLGVGAYGDCYTQTFFTADGS